MMEPVEPEGNKCCCCITCDKIIDALSKVINDIFIKMVREDRRRGERRENNE